MSEELELKELTLTSAGQRFVSAAQIYREGKARPYRDFKSLSGISGSVNEFVEAIFVARASLIDASKTAALSVAELLEHSDQMDEYISQNLGAGFAVPPPPTPRGPSGTV